METVFVIELSDPEMDQKVEEAFKFQEELNKLRQSEFYQALQSKGDQEDGGLSMGI